MSRKLRSSRLRQRHGRRLRAGSAGADRLRGVPLDTELDHNFPRYNPNPEDMEMLHAIRDKVLETGADVGLGFDGDGDRCGMVDNEGNEIFADKVGVMLARDISALHPEIDLRRGREVDRAVHDRPVLRRTARRQITGRPAIPTSSAALPSSAPSPASKNRGISSSIRRSGGAMMTALSRQSPCARCSTAILKRRWPIFFAHFRRLRHADHVAALRRRSEIRRRRTGARGLPGDAGKRRDVRGPEDCRPHHGQRRARGRRGWHLGAWSAPRRTSRKWWWWSKARFRRSAAAQMFEGVDAVLRRSPEVGAYNQTF